MKDYQVRSLTPQAMDAEENAKPETEYDQKDGNCIKATLNLKDGTFRVVVYGNVLESVVIN